MSHVFQCHVDLQQVSFTTDQNPLESVDHIFSLFKHLS